MNVIKQRILNEMKPYKDFYLHKDLISFCVDSECFEDWGEIMEKNDGYPMADFSELTVVVEKDWLFSFMRTNSINNPLDYLQNEYTSDDSYEWFLAAKEAGKVVLVGF